MAEDAIPQMDENRELVLQRRIEAPRWKLYKAWTEPDLLMRWFAPLPYLTTAAELDLRPGGACNITMRGPDGTEFPSNGVYLEVVENTRLVFTDAFSAGWVPSEKPFMTGIITFEEDGDATLYTARARHWTAEDREAHEKMGFHEGWGQCADQLAALAATI